MNSNKKETKLKSVVFLDKDKVLKQNTNFEDIETIIKISNSIFDDLVKDYSISGTVIVEFVMKKVAVDINVITTEEVDENFKNEFDRTLENSKLPFSKKKPIKFILLYLVNRIDNLN